MDEDMSPWLLVGVLAFVRALQEEDLSWSVRLSYEGMSSGLLVVGFDELRPECVNGVVETSFVEADSYCDCLVLFWAK